MSKLLCVCVFVSLAIIVRPTVALETSYYDPGSINYGCVSDTWYVMEKNKNETALSDANCFKVHYSYSSGVLNQSSTMRNGVSVRVMQLQLRQINNSPLFVDEHEPQRAVLYEFFTDNLCKYILGRRFNNDVAPQTPLGSEDVYYLLTKATTYNQAEANVIKGRYAPGIQFYSIVQDGCQSLS